MNNTTPSNPHTVQRLFTRDFVLVVIGQIISLFGNSILRFALPLYLLRQTGSAALFGLVSACSFLPMIVLSLLGGVVADRVNKRNIMVVLDFCTAGLILLFSLLYGFTPLVPLMLVTLMLLFGIQGAYQPAVQASMPALLAPERLLSGNAIINQISALSSLVGPVVGGWLMATVGIGPILRISILCFFLSAVMELFIHIPHTPRQTTGSAVAVVVADLRESFSFCRQKPILLKTMGLAVAINLFLSSLLVVGLPIIVTSTLGLGDEYMGYCQGAMGVGALLGGALTALLGNRLRMKHIPLQLLLCALMLLPMGGVLLLPLTPLATYWVVLASCTLGMAAATMANIQLLANVQAETPPQLVGKVISCLMAVAMSAQPVGQAIYGLLFQQLSAGLVVLGAAVCALVTCIYAYIIYKE